MYYLIINGAQAGPYPADHVQAMRAAGEIASDTLIWTEGQAEWQPVEQVLGEAPAGTVTPPPTPEVVAAEKVVRVGMFSFLGGVGVTLAIVGAVLVSILVIIGGFIGYAAYTGSGLDKSSKEYVDASVPAIVTGWSPDELVKRESKAFQKATNDDQLVKLFGAFRKLGALKSYEGCKGDSNISYTTENGKVITAAYIAHAVFDNGTADIKVNLIQENGAWRIQGFRIDSPIFAQ